MFFPLFTNLNRPAETNNKQALEDETGEGFQNISVDIPMCHPRMEFFINADRIPEKAGPDGDGARL